MEDLLARLKGPGTVRGALALLALFGVTISPEHADKVMQGGLALYAIIQAFRAK